MKFIKRFLFLILSLLLIAPIVVSGVVDSQFTETGGAGFRVLERKETNDLGYDINHFIDISETMRSGSIYKQHVNVLEVPTSTDAKIVSYANLNYHKWTLTTVRNLARQFEEENPSWKVIAAINADFFDIGGKGNLPYQTSNAVVSNGEYYKTSYNRSIVGFTNDGTNTSLIAGKPTKTENMKLAVYDENDQIIKEFDIHKLNTNPLDNETSIFFGTYDATHTFVPKTVNIGSSSGYYVQNAELALPNNPNDFYGKGVISSTNPSIIDRGEFAIVTNNEEVNNALAIGVKIRAQFEFTGEFANITSATGFDGHVLHNGEYQVPTRTDLSARHPRTTIGVKPDGTIIMATIDGRQATKGMEGIHGDEMAAIMKRYGAIEAFNLDGGGSTTMMIRKDGDFVITNSPSDGNERKDSNALLVAVRMPDIKYDFTEQKTNSITITSELLNNNGMDVQELYIELNGESKKVTDEPITFNNLDYNTEYYYKFKYLDSNGNTNDLLVDGTIKTLKRVPQILSIEVKELEIFFELKVIYEDPDNASLIKVADINFNGKNGILNDSKIVLLKSMYGEKIENIDISYSYDLNDGRKTNTINDIGFKLVSSIEVEKLEYIYFLQDDFIDIIYK